MKKLIAILLSLILILFTIAIQSAASQVDTRIKYIDLNYTVYHLEDQGNMTAFIFKAVVELWNHGTEEESIDLYYWHGPYCDRFLNVEANTSFSVVSQPNVYHTTCSIQPIIAPPGTSVINAEANIGFIDEIDKLPLGTYKITAPTDKGDTYGATIISNGTNIDIEYSNTPEEWGNTSKLPLISTIPIHIFVIALIALVVKFAKSNNRIKK